jgi:hypothetical protein
MEHNFTLALFNLDKFFSNAPANVPEELKHDWVKVHGLVYHKDNVVIVANQERDQLKAKVAELQEQLKKLDEQFAAAIVNGSYLLMEHSDDEKGTSLSFEAHTYSEDGLEIFLTHNPSE